MQYDAVESILRDILDAIPDGVYVTNAKREIVYWNEGAERITGYTSGDVLGSRCCDDILDHVDSQGLQMCASGCPLTATLDTGDPQNVREMYVRRDDGERLGVYVKTRTLIVDGETFGVEVFGELATVAGRDAARTIQELATTPITDPLTGLFNRDYADALIEQHFAMFKRLGLRFAVTRVDIDNLDEINADYGKTTGDEAIRFVASILSNNTRKMDTIARFAGDDFVIVSHVGPDVDASEIGERSLRLVRGSQLLGASEEIVPLTVSVGEALAHDDDLTPRSAIERATAALEAICAAGGDGFSYVS
jgi:diguanylate cyclase (GGDEF)-like protein/PAS domain S-box-containing protein